MNTVGKLVDAWYSLLNGSISVPVYRVDVPENIKSNFVIIRPEGGTGDNNKRSFNDIVTIIVDVVTKFENNANQRIAEGIDVEIFDKVLPTPQGGVLNPGSGMQVLELTRQSFTYEEQYNGVKTYYHKISRYNHRIHQTN